MAVFDTKMIQGPDKQGRFKLLCSADQCDKLREVKIPGLFVWSNNRGAFGEISAVAAGAICLGFDNRPLFWASRPPIENDKLRDYQKAAVAILLTNLKNTGSAILADDLGLGKTRTALVTSSILGGRVLILCPASVRLQWAEELKTLGLMGGSLVIDPYTHTKLKKNKLDLTSSRYIITSYDLASKIYDKCFPSEPPNVLVLDEAHNLSGRGEDGKGNIRTKALKSVAININYKLALTGTPIWNHPRDLWKLWDIIGIKVPRWDFDVRYCNGHINEWGGMENKGISNPDELALRLGYYMVRRTKQEVAKELPELTRTIEWLDPVEDCTLAFEASKVSPNGNSLSKALKATDQFKLKRAAELAVQARQFLLFTYRKEHAYSLQALIEESGAKCIVITGDLTTNARNALIKEAESKKLGIVATIDSCGVGVNLQGVASVGIFHALDWVPNALLQAEARLHRLGQKNIVQWIYLAVRKSADEYVVRTVVRKLDHWQKIFGTAKQDKGLKDTLDDSLVDINLEQELIRNIFESTNIGEDNLCS